MNIRKKITLTAAVAILSFGISFSQVIVPQKDSKKETWGYMNPSTNKWVVKPQYESAGELQQQPNGKMRAVVTKKGLRGFVDESGKALGAGIVFESMTPLKGDAMLVSVKGKQGVVNYDGIYLIKPEITAIDPVENEGYIFTVNNKQGFFTNDGQIKVPAKDFAVVRPFDKNIWMVSKDNKGEKFGLLRTGDNKPFVDCRYSDIKSGKLENTEYYFVNTKNGMGLVDKDGKEVLRCRNKSISNSGFYNMVLCEDNNGKHSVFLPADGVSLELRNFIQDDYPLGIKLIKFQFETPWENYKYLFQKEKEVFNKRGFVKSGIYEFAKDANGRYYSGLNKDEKDGFTILSYNGPEHGSKLYTYILNGKVVANEASSPLNKAGSWLYNDNEAFDTSKPNSIKHKVKEFNQETYVLLDDGLYHKLSKKGELSEDGFEDYASGRGNTYLKKVNGQWGLYMLKGYITPSEELVTLIDYKDRNTFNELRNTISDYNNYYTFTSKGKVGMAHVDRGKFDLVVKAEYDSIQEFYRNEFNFIFYKDGKCFLYNIVDKKPKTRAYDKLTRCDDSEYNFIYDLNGLQGFVDFFGKEACPARYSGLTYDPNYKLYRGKRNGKTVFVDWLGSEYDGSPQVWVSADKAHIYTRRDFGRNRIVQMSFGFSVGTMFAEGHTYKVVAKLTNNGKPIGSKYEYTTTVSGSEYEHESSDGVFFDVENLKWYEGMKSMGCKVFVYDKNGKLVASKTL